VKPGPEFTAISSTKKKKIIQDEFRDMPIIHIINFILRKMGI